MKLRLSLVMAAFLFSGSALAKDEFDGIRCESDIAKALIGRHESRKPLDDTVARHPDLGLKGLGGEELESGNEVWWQICGDTYSLLLDKHDAIRDVLKLPAQAGTAVLEGDCKGGPKGQEVIAIVELQPGAAELRAKSAWKIDDPNKRFVPVAAEGLSCPKEGLLDGGQ